mmetsp:Transcript_27047/g.62340  ORF Transcript_27047/g.62340 Transcript_27047/m.62340 type:complete len:200 (+) Transcript_27047:156-755(+)
MPKEEEAGQSLRHLRSHTDSQTDDRHTTSESNSRCLNSGTLRVARAVDVVQGFRKPVATNSNLDNSGLLRSSDELWRQCSVLLGRIAHCHSKHVGFIGPHVRVSLGNAVSNGRLGDLVRDGVRPRVNVIGIIGSHWAVDIRLPLTSTRVPERVQFADVLAKNAEKVSTVVTIRRRMRNRVFCYCMKRLMNIPSKVNHEK